MSSQFLISPLRILVVACSALYAGQAAAQSDPAEFESAAAFVQTLANDTIAILQDDREPSRARDAFSDQDGRVV